MAELENQVTHLQDKVGELENRSRRNYFIAFGIKEESKETAEPLIKWVPETVSEKIWRYC